MEGKTGCGATEIESEEESVKVGGVEREGTAGAGGGGKAHARGQN